MNRVSHDLGGDSQTHNVSDATLSPNLMRNPPENRQNALIQNSFADVFDSLYTFNIPDDFDFGQLRVDWLDVSDHLSADWARPEEIALNQNDFSNSQESPCSALPEDMAFLPAQNNGDYFQVDSSGLVTGAVSDPAPDDHDASRQQWPFDAEHDTARQRYQVPQIRQVLQTRLQSNNKETPFLDSLTELFSGTYLSIPEARQGTFAALQVVKKWLESYFREFHAVSPVIHAPTWNIENYPTILIATMSLIGASSSATNGPGKEQLAALSQLCSKTLPLIVSKVVLLTQRTRWHPLSPPIALTLL
jgi:hypothetical protein